MKLIVTRPLGQAAPWVTRLQALGVEAQALPLIRIEPLADTSPVRHAWLRMASYSLVVFVSANAVQYFFAAAPGLAPGEQPVWPPGLWAGSTGPGTTAALAAARVPATLLVQPDPAAGRFDSEGLWEELQFRPWAGRRVLVVRGEEGRDWLADALRARGAEVDFIASYRRLPPQMDGAGRVLFDEALAEPEHHVWHFSSSEAIGWLRQIGAARRPPADWQYSLALGSHPRIVQTARETGFAQVALVGPSVQAVVQWWQAPVFGRARRPGG